MRINSIPDLLAAPVDDEEARLVCEALAERLNLASLPGALDRWRERRAAEIAALDERVRTRAWTLFGDQSAQRRDGLSLGVPWTGSPPTQPASWAVRFPQAPQEPTVVRYDYVPGPSLAEAMAQVDAKWPMPAWWLAVRRME